MSKRAVILFNLGGPDSPKAVRPFLFNLFNDKAIISVPGWIRWAIATLISARRATIARDIYAKIGGRSPILELTQAQAAALEKELAGGDGEEVRVFIAMRYWHPRARQTAAEVAEFDPDEIVLLPLYPQFSTTTTASSLEEWRGEAIKVGLNVPSYAICCYPAHAGFIRAQAQILQTTLGSAPAGKPMRVLFSAHGLPEKIVQSGDPYPDQALKSAVAIAAAAGLIEADWALCYQSRVGPLKWIGPSLGDELARAAHDQVGVVILPIAFVSEHSETLVELDMEYRHIAENLGVAPYLRAPALADNSEFITGLADIVRAAFAGKAAIMSAGPGHACSAPPSSCPLHAAN